MRGRAARALGKRTQGFVAYIAASLRSFVYAAPAHRKIRRVARRRLDQRTDGFVEIINHAENVQNVLGTGHCNIKNSLFLFNLLAMEFHAYNILNQSGLHPAFFVVYKRKADADILVHRNLATRSRIIQPAAETCQKHHRKLETLGFVNRHDADCIIALRRHLDLTHGNLVLLYGIDVLHEAVKGAALRLTVGKCFIAKCPQVCLAAAPRRHCTHSNIESCVEHQLPNQLFERNQPCLLPPRSKVGKRIPAFLAKNRVRTILCISQHCVVIRTPLRACRTDACELVDREVPDFRTHHRDQRNVLLFVVDDFEQG